MNSTLTPRSAQAARDEYLDLVDTHNQLVAKMNSEPEPSGDDLNTAEKQAKRLKGLELEIQAAERLERDSADNAVARLGGQLRSKVAASDDHIGPSIVRGSSGREVRMAFGKQRLSKGGIPQNAIGELVRAAACGVKAFTPREVRMAIRSDENSAGGYAVPSEWLADWIDRAIEASVLGTFAQRAMMTTESANITTVEARPVIKTKAQLAKFNDASITFGSRVLNAFTAGATMQASLEMLEDSPNASRQIEVVSLRALADWFDKTMLVGTGSAEPLGMMSRTDLPGDNSVGAITWDALADAVTEVRSEIYPTTGIVMSPAVYNALHIQRELSGGDGGYLAKPEHLRDVPLLQTTHCPDDKILVGDLGQILIGVREDARVEVSNAAGESFERNAVTFRVKLRADFLPLDVKAFYLLKGVTLS